jgi:hypothetical protein
MDDPWLLQNTSGSGHCPEDIGLTDFFAYMPGHTYLFVPSRQLWPLASVNARLPKVTIGNDKDGKPIRITPGRWLDQNRPVEQMTWVPGWPTVIEGRLTSEGGWIEHSGCSVFNLYRPPPSLVGGNPGRADPWLDHLRKVYPDDADHILAFLAHRIQRPEEKINHALLLGGAFGIGKDTLLEPVKCAIGAWNWQEISPRDVLGRFNGFVKSVVLRVNEARDLGDISRFSFYDHMKALTAAPPDVLRVDEKHTREYNVWNVCAVVVTTNYKTDGIYLPHGDRRHYVAWSPLIEGDFPNGYWNSLWQWYDRGGIEHVAAYLASFDLSAFNPKAPPPKTPAFWDIVNANRAPEEAELADVIDKLGNPNVFTLAKLTSSAEQDLAAWLADRRNRRVIPHRLESCSYVPVRNPDDRRDGQWKIGGKRHTVYAKSELSIRDQLKAARDLTGYPTKL